MAQQEIPIRRRKRRFRFRKTSLLLLAFVVVLAFWPAFRWLALCLLRTEQSHFGEVERAYKGQGILLPREYLLLAPMGGKVELLVEEGNRVPQGAKLVKITNEDLKQRLLPKLEEVEKQLEQHDQEARLALSRASGKVEEKQLAIDNDTLKLKNQLSRRNYVAARQLEERLARLTQERRDALEALADLERQLAAEREKLVKNKESLVRQLQRAETIISAKQPGLVSFHLDGLEDLCQKTRYDALFAQELQAKSKQVKDSTQIQVGEPVGKLIDNHQCQVALCIETTEKFAEGQAVWLRMPGGLEKARIRRASTSGDLTYLLCSLENYKPQWNQRTMDLSVIVERREGTIVPAKALTTREGREGVWLRQGGQLVWKEVKVLLKTKEQAVVDGLPTGQAVIRNPRFLR